MKILRIATTGSCALAVCLFVAACKKDEPIDDANAAGKTTADFPQITADVFKPMDGGIELTPEEIMGRNTWNLWTGGNQYFWDRIAREGYGLIDLLKMLIRASAARDMPTWALSISLVSGKPPMRMQKTLAGLALFLRTVRKG